MSDHRENIFAAVESYTARSRDDVENEDGYGLEESVLDVTVWRSNHGDRRVGFLLACGGPTVSVEVDEGDRVTFSHSWGMNPETGADCVTSRVWDDNAAFWVEQADEYADAYSSEVTAA